MEWLPCNPSKTTCRQFSQLLWTMEDSGQSSQWLSKEPPRPRNSGGTHFWKELVEPHSNFPSRESVRSCQIWPIFPNDVLGAQQFPTLPVFPKADSMGGFLVAARNRLNLCEDLSASGKTGYFWKTVLFPEITISTRICQCCNFIPRSIQKIPELEIHNKDGNVFLTGLIFSRIYQFYNFLPALVNSVSPTRKSHNCQGHP